jgi:hypothetical protein
MDMLFKSVALFLFIYSSKFKFGEVQFSTWEIGFAFFLILYIIKRYFYKEKREGWKTKYFYPWWILEIATCLFSVFWSVLRALNNTELSGSSITSLLSPFIFIIFALIAPVMILYVYDDFWQFLYSLMYINLFQSLFCIVELRWMPLKMWLNDHIVNEGNISYLVLYRAKGIGGEGAGLSVAMAFGILAACIILVGKEKKLKYYIYIFIMLISLILVGRTGIYVSVVFLAVLIYVNMKNNRNTFSSIKIHVSTIKFFMLLSAIVFSFLLWMFLSYDFMAILQEHNLGSAYGRIGQTYKISGFMEDFLSWSFPPINMDSILGYGVRTYYSENGLTYGDNGYIINTLIYGYLVGSIRYTVLAFYLYNLWLPCKYLKYGKLLGLLIPLAYILNIKEQFIQYNYMIFYISVIFMFYSTTKNKEMKMTIHDFLNDKIVNLKG